jgi:hypothetical protein
LKSRLQTYVDDLARFGHPAITHRLVLAVGRPGVSGHLPWPLTRMPSKMCFKNAFDLAMHHQHEGKALYYVEGFACIPDIPLEFHHAWVETEDRRVIDPTWDHPKACRYWGIKFDSLKLAKETARRGVYSLFDPLDMRLVRELWPEVDAGLGEFRRSGQWTK